MATLVGCAAIISITVFQQPDTTQLAVQRSPLPITLPITEKELDLAPPLFFATFDMRSTLLPASRDIPSRSLDRLRSGEFVPLQLEWESFRDLPLPDE